MIWFRSANSHTGPQLHRCTIKAGQMAASDYVPIFFKNRLHLTGRPQMSTRPRAKHIMARPHEILELQRTPCLGWPDAPAGTGETRHYLRRL